MSHKNHIDNMVTFYKWDKKVYNTELFVMLFEIIMSSTLRDFIMT